METEASDEGGQGGQNLCEAESIQMSDCGQRQQQQVNSVKSAPCQYTPGGTYAHMHDDAGLMSISSMAVVADDKDGAGSTAGTLDTAMTTVGSSSAAGETATDFRCGRGLLDFEALSASSACETGMMVVSAHSLDHLRPILVGYAFGPKKMSTMGIIMAEASKALSTVVTAAVPIVGAGAGPAPGEGMVEGGAGIGDAQLLRRSRERMGGPTMCGHHGRHKRRKMDRSVPLSLMDDERMADSNGMEVSYCLAGAASDQQSPSDNCMACHGGAQGGDYRLLPKQKAHNVHVNRLTTAALEARGRKPVADEVGETDHEAAQYNALSLSPLFGGVEGNGGIRFSIAGADGANCGLRNIVRFFRSSCSSAASVADSSTTGTATTVPTMPPPSSSSAASSLPVRNKCGASMTGGGANNVQGMAAQQSNQQQQRGSSRLLRPIRVSFVPLDLDSPLEEQHGGNFDAILHKLTEDILCLSKISSYRRRSLSNGRDQDPSLRHEEEFFREQDGASDAIPNTSVSPLDESQKNAVRRVERLNRYKRDHPACCMVDHPSHIQALMSRSDIANILSDCLVDVTTTSGIPVSTPRFEVVESCSLLTGCSNDIRPCCPHLVDDLAKRINNASFTYPLIAKPLTAAGTVESHRMVVVLGHAGLRRIQMPSLLQEYANHGGVLYKVYVLGDTVRVFSRPSLPDLPLGRALEGIMVQRGYVEFDSQRPYPKISDFVTAESVAPGAQVEHDRETWRSTTAKEHSRSTKYVTADEIRPVVSVLRKAFGLELFGFDVLVTRPRGESSDPERTEMLVVDVNYFPSYKEVSNFPSLLAQYLTQRAIEGRMKSSKLGIEIT